MLDYMILPFRHYAQFSGRSRWMEFWSFALLQMIVGLVLIGVVVASSADLASFISPDDPTAIYGLFTGGVGLLLLIWWLATIIPSIAVSVRRLHDRNMSGWWYLGYVLVWWIPLIGLLASLAMLVIMVLPGTPGANRFGPDPKLGTQDFASG